MSSLALYRRYRPETYAEVIGQEHVTDPLQQALRNNRVNHAYLFSGPRGCGKTTSARILARCLNCVQGPTPSPCGECQSCMDLARGGGGSIDVIEIDAASHGGVDDARDLREKAFFGPASSRYKIYIIDEAHMVTPAGFNALLKVVEEPPEHLKFIFATTEPEKVIGTIRSRTHHYPFRLVPPGTLRDYLAQVCGQEQIPVEETVLPLVVRAGAGSVRDSMSVMDQLLAGAGEQGVTYDMATALLGYTDSALLDSVVEAFATADGAAAFEVVDRVIEGGHDPRRFVTDLLERLRDLVILAAVPDAAEKGLLDVPADVRERMEAQASAFGPAELSRAADLVNTGLTEMRGATSPRLQLELICARVLLPAAYGDERAMQARLDRLERGVALGGGAVQGGPVPGAGAVAGPPVGGPGVEGPVQGGPVQGVPGGAEAGPPPPSAPPQAPVPVSGGGEPRRPGAWPSGSGAAQSDATSSLEGDSAGSSAGASAGSSGGGATADLAQVQRLWPQVLDEVKSRRRFTWILLSQNARVSAFDGKTVQLSFSNSGARDSFGSGGSEEVLVTALRERFQVEWKIETVVDADGSAGGPGGPGGFGGGPGGPGGGFGGVGAAGGGFGGGPAFGSGGPQGAPGGHPEPPDPGPGGPHGSTASAPSGQSGAEAYGASGPRSGAAEPVGGPSSGGQSGQSRPGGQGGQGGGQAAGSAPGGEREARPAAQEPPASGGYGGGYGGGASVPHVSAEDDIPQEDDADLDESALSGHELIVRELGATVIEEISHQ
ncbi:DNA polymerase III subunit gamma and tau [Streptomyces sp. XM4193]|uniref:DNA polymerase III subunit gamma and tau n=1 Tax=Streptomyces sp. XM4193 TaxID=2929782 RepID=UPI001FF73202|nr:DNA polymerase III subunit gamma and tau [Streptomyces sp. XM4193]MCK1795040.1 DNA polymerase III subunit gamma and tau [Streptomyces sp. XM4193]